MGNFLKAIGVISLLIVFGASCFIGNALLKANGVIVDMNRIIEQSNEQMSFTPTPDLFVTVKVQENPFDEYDVKATVETELTTIAPTPDFSETAVYELTRTAPTPTTQQLMLIITDSNGHPVYTGPLTLEQVNQCKQIAASDRMNELPDYQRPLCVPYVD